MSIRIFKLFLLLTSVVLLSNGVNAQKKKKKKKKDKKTITMELNSETDTVGYALGVNIGSQIKTQFKDIDLDILAQAIKDAYAGNTKISQAEAGPILQKYAESAQARMAEENLKEGEAFLAENAKRKEVTTTASGLQYEVLKEGTGEKPTTSSTVEVHYHGTLIDGTVFDSSVERGQPASFGVTQVIPGWTEALQLMTVGSKWKVFLPSSIAYGERGAGGSIGPNAALIFEVELLSIK